MKGCHAGSKYSVHKIYTKNNFDLDLTFKITFCFNNVKIKGEMCYVTACGSMGDR